MKTKRSRLIAHSRTLGLALTGLVLFVVSTALSGRGLSIDWYGILAQLGIVLSTVGVLQWLFDVRLRNEMLGEASAVILGSQRLFQGGITDCLLGGEQLDEMENWEVASQLVVGRQYSPKFVENHHDLITRRCKRGLRTTFLVLEPESEAARWLISTGTGLARVADGVSRIEEIIREIDPDGAYTRVIRHDRVLRYSFILTEQAIWIKFFTNSKMRVKVPALRLTAGSPLFAFFADDIDNLAGGLD